uniref:Uncharacterized protein n=1 Tax=Phaeomonas parva TaxID=124430 RepID=A0A7S1XQ72_9STRA|mmetsp:Transcript_2375/g.7062  ORF Transcript_2375/g.7062 Transcript_2375/m.7062 type:complete len:386 (+) Transcript_2375:185-1342(+)
MHDNFNKMYAATGVHWKKVTHVRSWAIPLLDAQGVGREHITRMTKRELTALDKAYMEGACAHAMHGAAGFQQHEYYELPRAAIEVPDALRDAVFGEQLGLWRAARDAEGDEDEREKKESFVELVEWFSVVLLQDSLVEGMADRRGMFAELPGYAQWRAAVLGDAEFFEEESKKCKPLPPGVHKILAEVRARWGNEQLRRLKADGRKRENRATAKIRSQLQQQVAETAKVKRQLAKVRSQLQELRQLLVGDDAAALALQAEAAPPEEEAGQQEAPQDEVEQQEAQQEEVAVESLSKSLSIAHVVDEWHQRGLARFEGHGKRSRWKPANTNAFSRKKYLVHVSRRRGVEEMDRERVEMGQTVPMYWKYLKELQVSCPCRVCVGKKMM